MKIITMQTILDALETEAKTDRGCAMFMLAFIVFILATAGAAFFSVYGLIFALFFGGILLFFLRNSKKTRRTASQKAFYIVTDVCRKKDYHSDIEYGDDYIVTFESGLEHNLTPSDANLSAKENNGIPSWLYNSVEPGDRFYLLYIEKAQKPTFVFPQKLCQLDMTGFVERDGRIYPRK